MLPHEYTYDKATVSSYQSQLMYTIAKDLSLCSVYVHHMQVFNLHRTDAEGSHEHELSGNISII